MIKNAKKESQSVTSDWNKFNSILIAGVIHKEVKNVIKDNGYLTELFRPEWFDGDAAVKQIFKVMLHPGGLSAWHQHRNTLDRIAVFSGTLKLVLFDGRKDSPTAGTINEFLLSDLRPGTVIIPAGVWHGVQNISSEPSFLINMVDLAYKYEDPDHWKVPANDPQIPYTFK
jgi:dTDP-4-dehydrorhamnose 3,5-epimerase